jgi:hypothetical protein
MILGDGQALVVGRTLESARVLRDARPELAGARLGSPLSGRSLDGLRVREVYVEEGLERLSPGMLPYVRRLAWLLARALRKVGAEVVFHVLPVDGGPAVAESAEAYYERVRPQDAP